MATPANLASEVAGVRGPGGGASVLAPPGSPCGRSFARAQDWPVAASGLKKPSETGTTFPPLYCTMRIVGWTICGAEFSQKSYLDFMKNVEGENVFMGGALSKKSAPPTFLAML